MSEARAAIFEGPGRAFALRWFPYPVLGPGEALVAVSMATLCGSDLHTVEGRRVEPTPSILGHEGVGRVVALGEGRDPGLLGRRITWSLADSCGGCEPCVEWDLPQKCRSLFKYGHAPLASGSGLNGCYATHLVIRAGTAVIALPDEISDAMAAPANCALATMCAAVERAPEPRGTAVLQGGGLLGLYGCALLRHRGWKRVLVVESRRERLDWIRAFGGEPVPASLSGTIPEGSVEVVLETAGDPGVVPEGIRMIRPGGTYVWVGMVHPQSALNLTGEAVIRKCLTVHGMHNYAPRHLAMAVEFLASQATKLPWSMLISPPFPLEQLDAAFELARTGTWPRVAVAPLPGLRGDVSES